MTLEKMNIALFQLINAPQGASHAAIFVAVFLAQYLLYVIPLFLVVSWLWTDDKEVVLKAFITAIIVLGIAKVIGYFYPHPRPFMLGLGQKLIEHPSTPSFPSDHMALFVSIALVYQGAKKYATAGIFAVMSLCVAWSRIYLGVHFPFDMAGSILLVFFVSAALKPVWRQRGQSLTTIAVLIYQKILAFPLKKGWVR